MQYSFIKDATCLGNLVKGSCINPFPANVPLTDLHFYLKSHSSTGVFFTHFASKNQLPGFSISGTLARYGLT